MPEHPVTSQTSVAISVEPPAGASPDSVQSLSLRQLLDEGAVEQKRHAVFLLLRNLLGARFNEEVGVYDPEGFLYACIMSPGLRERLRLLEDPERAERLLKAAREEETIPMRQVIEELRALDN